MDSPVDAIVEAYVQAANGDLRESLPLARCARSPTSPRLIVAQRADRLISRGYARERLSWVGSGGGSWRAPPETSSEA
jgi:hypothetical protein